MKHDAQSTQISQKQDRRKICSQETMCSPGYHRNFFVTAYTLGQLMYGQWKSNSAYLRIARLMLREINFPNYQYFEDVNREYSDLFKKLMTVIDNVAPCKTTRVKGNTQNWFDGEVLEKLRSRDKLFKGFKKTRLHIDTELYKKAKYNAQKLIAAKKQAFFDKKLSETVEKTKEIWNTLKSLGMPKKTVVSNFNAIDNNKSLTYDIKTMSKSFRRFLLKFS